MTKTHKRILASALAVAVVIGSAIFSNFALNTSAAEYKPNPVQTALGITASDATPVSTFNEFKSAVEAGTPVVLKNDIKATGNLGANKKNQYIDKNIVIFGDNKTLDMGSYQFILTGSHTLFVSDLTINTANGKYDQRYGLFCLVDGSAKSSNFVWQSGFHNLTFNGSALVGADNSTDYEKTTRYFGLAAFSGDTNITITNSYSAQIAVVLARDVNISGAFNMYDNVQGKNTGSSNPTYAYYFKSPGTGGSSSEDNNTTGLGSFVIEDGAAVNMTRSPAQGTDAKTSGHYRSLIFGYANHNFGERASFYAKAGTNLHYSPASRSAVIRSNNASSFIVGNGATVKLETDLVNTSSKTSKNGDYGYTALSLKKSGNLDILVQPGATLDILADGRDVSGCKTRSQAPVVIWGTGSSNTTVHGGLSVASNNGNGWYYEYSTCKAGNATFTVESTGQVDILAYNQGVKGAEEYAAFEASGKYDVDITVRDGGKMNVTSNGYRGMSLAGAAGYNNKNILVTGAGSQLNVVGVHWAISAESQPILNIAAENGGLIDLNTSGNVTESYYKCGTSASGAHSALYSVGPATYRVDGPDSKMNVVHAGGGYSAIFHEGYGALQIFATNGGVMDVYNAGSNTPVKKTKCGTKTYADTKSSRAAIHAENTYKGNYKSYDNKIVVDGEGSALTVVNDNTEINSKDTNAYPTGAVSFNSSAKGNITVSNGADFKAVSTSHAPTIHLYTGKISFEKPGEFEIRNDVLDVLTSKKCSSKNESTTGHAVYNAGRKDKTFYTAIDFVECDVVVWAVLGNNHQWDNDYIENQWAEATFSAKNNSIAITGTEGAGGITTLAKDQFSLDSYGRITGTGEPGGMVDPPPAVKDKSDPPTIDEVREADKEITGTGVPDAEVTIIFPDLSEETVVVGSDGKWSVKVPKYLWEDEIIYAYQVEPTLAPSDNVETIVLEYVSVPGGAPLGDVPQEGFEFESEPAPEIDGELTLDNDLGGELTLDLAA